jgi:hypothetical protein
MPDPSAIRAEALQEEDVLRVILEQHERILDLFIGVRAATGEARSDALRELRALLVVHETAEQLAVRPVTSELLGPDYVENLARAETEVTQAISHLEDVPPEQGQFDENLDALETIVLDHFHVEESEELPALLDQCPVEDRLSMGRRVLAGAKVLPTRAHPAIDGAGTVATVATAPITSIIDRARDAIAREASASD